MNDGDMILKTYISDVECLLDEHIFYGFLEHIRAERREKCVKYRFPKDRALSLGAGLLIKKAVTDYGVDYDTCVIKRHENGKPYIADAGFDYNVSHSGNKVICAISDTSVGCDIQEPELYKENLVNRFFHEKEIEYLKAFDENLRDDEFTRLWTIKESYIKCTGDGMSRELSSFGIVPKNRGYALYGIEEDYSFTELETDSYKISVCTKEKRNNEIIVMDFNKGRY